MISAVGAVQIKEMVDSSSGRPPEFPPVGRVAPGCSVAAEHAPAPLVNKVAERQERHLVQGLPHQIIQDSLCVVITGYKCNSFAHSALKAVKKTQRA